MSKNTRPPKWVMNYAAKCKAALGIGAWDVRVAMKPELSFEGQPAKGHHTTNWQTIESNIELHSDLPKTDEGYSVITHELLHVAVMEYFAAFQATLDFVPKEYHRHCEDLFKNAEERTVESLARSLTPVLRAVREAHK